MTADYKSSTYNRDVGVALAGPKDEFTIFVLEQFRKNHAKEEF